MSGVCRVPVGVGPLPGQRREGRCPPGYHRGPTVRAWAIPVPRSKNQREGGARGTEDPRHNSAERAASSRRGAPGRHHWPGTPTHPACPAGPRQGDSSSESPVTLVCQFAHAHMWGYMCMLTGECVVGVHMCWWVHSCAPGLRTSPGMPIRGSEAQEH